MDDRGMTAEVPLNLHYQLAVRHLNADTLPPTRDWISSLTFIPSEGDPHWGLTVNTRYLELRFDGNDVCLSAYQLSVLFQGGDLGSFLRVVPS